MAQQSKTIIRSQQEVVNMSLSAWRAQVLYVGVEIGLFQKLAAGPKTIDQLCEELNCPERSLERLVIAAHSMRLLECEGEHYTNSRKVEDTLVPGQPGYTGNWIRLIAKWYKPWGRLEQAIRSGKHVEDSELHLGGDSDYTRDFIMGMHDYASHRGADIVNHLQLGGCRRLIDVGGGPGTYSIIFARQYQNLYCTVFDLPEVLKITREIVDSSGVADRIELMPGNYYDDDLGEGYDVAFLSDMLHQEDPATGLMLLEKAHRCLRPGGRVVVQAMFLRDDHSGPEWPALHNLLMLLVYRGGKAYSVKETVPWLKEAGFTDVTQVPMSFWNVNSLLVAHKPS